MGGICTNVHFIKKLWKELKALGASCKFSQALGKLENQPLLIKSENLCLFRLTMLLPTAQSHLSFESTQRNPEAWRNLIESVIGAHLINSALSSRIEIFYWKEGNYEVDFVIRKGETVLTLTVKPSKKGVRLGGVEAFSKVQEQHHNLIVGEGGIPVDEFLLTPLEAWMDFRSEKPRKRA
jgi:hypothetical protein